MFERGFKSWCENVALQIRKDLELGPTAPLDPSILAEHLGVKLVAADRIEGLSPQARAVLTGSERGGWSAMTVSFGGQDWVIYNPTHSEARRSSDILHELAHIFIGHTPATVVMSADGALAMRSFNRQQEDEASWLAGSFLLPRPALLAIAKSRRPAKDVCTEYGISQELLDYRLNVTGARLQARRRTPTRKD